MARVLNEHDQAVMRMVLAERGRWLVVYEDGTAYRHRSLSGARRHVSCLVGAIRARLLRYRRKMVRYLHGSACLEVVDPRWLP